MFTSVIPSSFESILPIIHLNNILIFKQISSSLHVLHNFHYKPLQYCIHVSFPFHSALPNRHHKLYVSTMNIFFRYAERIYQQQIQILSQHSVLHIAMAWKSCMRILNKNSIYHARHTVCHIPSYCIHVQYYMNHIMDYFVAEKIFIKSSASGNLPI